MTPPTPHDIAPPPIQASVNNKAVFLCDSNGKFIDGRKLFQPTQDFTFFRCPKIEHARAILQVEIDEESSGKPPINHNPHRNKWSYYNNANTRVHLWYICINHPSICKVPKEQNRLLNSLAANWYSPAYFIQNKHKPYWQLLKTTKRRSSQTWKYLLQGNWSVAWQKTSLKKAPWFVRSKLKSSHSW